MYEDKKVIVFDFFGVISSEVAPFWLERYFDKETAKEIKSKIVSQVDSGELTENELNLKLAELTNVSAETVKKEWKELVKIDSELVNYIKELRKEYIIALLSNASATFLRRILDENKLNNIFDVIMISSEEKITKPNIEIYERLLNKINVKPENSIMVEDNPKNLEGASKAGIKGILYSDFDKFLKDLNEALKDL